MYTDYITLPEESMIAGTTKNLYLYLYTKDMRKQIDARGMTARFAMTDYVNPSSAPIIEKVGTVLVPKNEDLAIITVKLDRSDTLLLEGKYLYQVTIKDVNNFEALKGLLNIAANIDVASI